MKLSVLPSILYLFSFVWIVFAVLWFFRNSDYRYLYTSLGLIYAAGFGITAYFIGKRKRWAWKNAIAFTGISILVSVFDEIGWIDAGYIASAVGLFILLLKEYPKNTRC